MTKRIKLREDESGVTVVIGAVLLLMILTMLYTTMQVYQVPVWNKGVEYEHQGVVYNDMMFLKSDIENVAMLDTPKSSNTHVGVRYPDRMVFINPGVGVSGILTVEDGVEIVVKYDASGSTYTETYNSSRITYEAYDTINSPKLVYEHGIIIRDWGTTNFTTDEQPLIAGNEIYLPVLIGNKSSISKIGTESIRIDPLSSKSRIRDVMSVNITLETEYPDVWIDIIPPSATIDGNHIYINSSAIKEIEYPAPVSPQGNLYAGLIKFSTEETLEETYTGSGVNNMATGSVWENIPNSSNITKFILTGITVDPSKPNALDTDVISFKVIDDSTPMNYWIVEVDFCKPFTITDIIGTTEHGTFTNATGIEFNSTTQIDLLTTLTGDGAYKNSSITNPNRLISTWVGDTTSTKPTKAALVYYKLIIE